MSNGSENRIPTLAHVGKLASRPGAFLTRWSFLREVLEDLRRPFKGSKSTFSGYPFPATLTLADWHGKMSPQYGFLHGWIRPPQPFAPEYHKR